MSEAKLRTFHRVGTVFVYDDEVLRIEDDGEHYTLLSGAGVRVGGGTFHHDTEGHLFLDTWKYDDEHAHEHRHPHPHYPDGYHQHAHAHTHAYTHGLDRDHHQIDGLEAEVQGLRVQLAPDQQAAHLEHTQLRAENARLHEALAFAASVIKSGESWTPTCEEMIGGALRGSSVTQPTS